MMRKDRSLATTLRVCAGILLIYIYGFEPQIALAQAVPGGEFRFQAITNPGPLPLRYRVFVDAANGNFTCLKPDGSSCVSASSTVVSVGTTTTGSAGSSASVTNSGTGTAPVLNFTIPQGATGVTGSAGPTINFRGAWAASTTYDNLDVVTNAGSTYEADHHFTSSSSFNPTDWNLWAAAGATGPAGINGTGTGTVTSFGTTTWPSWLTPTVTNATTTPNLDVSASTIPISAGGTGQTTQAAAIDALTGTQSAGKFLRSDGTHATLQNVSSSDVSGVEVTANKNATSGYPGLDANKIIGGASPAAQSLGIPVNSATHATAATCTSACSLVTSFTLNPGGVQQLHVGETLEFISMGFVSTTATPTLSMKFVASGVSTLGNPAAALTMATVTSVPWHCANYLTVTAASATYTFETQGFCVINGVSNDYANTGLNTAVSTTTATTIGIQPIWGTSSASNTITTAIQMVHFYN